MRNKLFFVLSVLVALSMVLAACAPATTGQGTEATSVPTVAETPTLRINLGTYPDVVDPQKSSYVNEIAHLKLIYQGLTAFNEKLETVPGAAEKWEYNSDATELTFTMRKGLKYGDGSLLNAKRFEYSVGRNVDPATGGEYASITDEIMGASEWRNADTGAADYDPETFKAALGVKALDSAGNACTGYDQEDCLTLKITLAKPAPYFHTVMALWVTYPAKEENIAEGGELWWNSSKYHSSNGPFMLKSLEPFVRGYFVPNPNYWDDKAKINIEYSYITDSAVSFEAYKNDEFDIIAAVAEDIGVIKADAVLVKEWNQYPGSCTTVIKLGEGPNSPFADANDGRKLREAFAYGFDAAKFTTDVLQGLSAPTLTWIPPGFPGYKEGETRWSFDVAKAKAALEEWGGAAKFNDMKLKFTIGDTPRNRTRAEWLIAHFQDNLGVSMALDPVEPTTFTALTKDPSTFPILAMQGWCADYPDPQNWLSVYWRSTTTFAQRQGYVNPEFDKLVDEADTTLDPVKRMELYQKAQDILIDSAPSVFGWNNTNSYMVKPWVKGITTTPQDSDWPGSTVPTNITIEK